jgi:hypothetical protein
MKLSWGGGIAIFYLAFMAIILAIVIYVAGFELNLETKDYYAEELKYQEVIDKKMNTNELEVKPKVYKKDGKLTIEFPDDIEIEGTLVMFRSSDNRLDKSFALELNDSGYQFIDIAKMRRGKWKAKLDWNDGEKEYYLEESVEL